MYPEKVSERTELRYGFRDRLKAEFPSQVIVDLTEVCNLACIHCPHPEFKQSRHYGARYLDPLLNSKLIDEICEYGRGYTQHVRYTSEGEPLVHPNCYDMLDYAVRNSGCLVSLTTNGTILNEKRIRKLLASGLHMIDVSIDAFHPETYAKIRVNGDLAVTRRNTLRMIELARETGGKTFVVVSYVEQELNRLETKEFDSFWKKNGASHVVVRRLHSAAGSVVRVADIMRKDAKAVPRRPCLYPWERILLNPAGQLRFCPQDWVHGSVVADYRNATIREVWQGEFYRQLRDAHLNNDYTAHQFCGQCPDWKETRWPGEGLSYADLVEEIKQAAK